MTIKSVALAASLAYLVQAASAAIVISPTTLPNWTVNAAYSQTLTAAGCVVSCTWSSSGTLPTGVSLDSSTGVISGIPGATGSFTFTVTASSVLNSGSQQYTVVINPLPIVTTTSLPNGSVNTSYSQTVSVANGTPPYRFAQSGTLPPGLTLDPSAGLISGTPNTPGTFHFTVTVTDTASVTASQTYTVQISGGSAALTITTTSPLPTGTVGSTYSSTLAATGGTQPYSWLVIVGALPDALKLNSSTGAITGTPSNSGNFTFTIQVTDSSLASASQVFTLAINPAGSTLTITTTSPLPNATVGTAYSQTLAASGGTTPYTWSVVSGALPGGMKLDSSAGTISGTPGASGASNFTIRVTDSASSTADQPFSLTVTSGSQSLPDAHISGVPGTASSAQQINFDLTLSSGYSSEITGQAKLSFQPNSESPIDDSAIQFSTGGREVSFTIPANATHAVFPATPMAFQTGTVAGTITLTLSLKAGGVDLSIPGLDYTVVVARAAAAIRTVTAAATATGFQVQVVGFSNSRDLTNARLDFTAAAGQNLQTTSLTVDLTNSASQWFSGSASSSFGSQFLLVLPFTTQGSASAIGSVKIQLSNAQGASASMTATF